MIKIVTRPIAFSMAVMFFNFLSCGAQQNTIDAVAALYSNTQVISNIEYKKVDSLRLLLDVYVATKRLGEPPWVEYSDNRKPTLLFYMAAAGRVETKYRGRFF